jgi:hypothetical protein
VVAAVRLVIDLQVEVGARAKGMPLQKQRAFKAGAGGACRVAAAAGMVLP